MGRGVVRRARVVARCAPENKDRHAVPPEWFRPGDPRVSEASALASTHTDAVPDKVDVLIVGCGPAGLTLAAQLAAFPDIRTCIACGRRCRPPAPAAGARPSAPRAAAGAVAADHVPSLHRLDLARVSRSGPLQAHRDRVVCLLRADRQVQEAAGIVRLEAAGRLAHQLQVEVVHPCLGQHHVRELRQAVLGVLHAPMPDVRKSIGRQLVGDSANQAWGVMDVLAITDFPDIRYKSAVQSGQGNLLVIPGWKLAAVLRGSRRRSCSTPTRPSGRWWPRS